MLDLKNPSDNKMINRRSVLAIAIGLAMGIGSEGVYAGAFVFAGTGNGIDLIAHPSGYAGAGGVLNVNVCIVPGSPFATDMEIPTQNSINSWNKLVPTTGNVVFPAPDFPFAQIDYESTALHEIGHCVGLAHPNLGSQTGVTGTDTNFTQSTIGPDNVFGFGAGVDGINGSLDDVRGDDENLHWFDMATNDPFNIQALTDLTTFSRALADLPVGHSYATNADRTVGAALGYADTEAVMQQGTSNAEAQRTLVADDIHTLNFAASGLDGVSGTSDDYTVNLQYQGITSTNCDINIKFDAAQTGFAVCQTGGVFLAGGVGTHAAITSANIFMNPNTVSWYFNQTPNMVMTPTCNGLPVDVDMGAGTGAPTTGDDVILGTSGVDIINSLAGNDTICAGDGADIINSGGGDDWIDAGPGDDIVDASAGNDTVFGGDGNDTINGGGGDDDIEGEDGDDTISGQTGSDTIDGGPGIDGINGGSGNDIISTGTGATVGTGIFVSGSGGDDEITGGPDADDIKGSTGADTINGGDGDDLITGGPGRDVIDGEAGDDNIKGQQAQDTINGGVGFDTLSGGDGNDTVNGGDDDDIIIGGPDDDVLRGDSGADDIKGGSGDDTLVGGPSSGDICNGQTGTDTAVASCETISGVP